MQLIVWIQTLSVPLCGVARARALNDTSIAFCFLSRLHFLAHTLLFFFPVCVCQSALLPLLQTWLFYFRLNDFLSALRFKEQERMRIDEADVNRLHTHAHTEVIPPKHSKYVTLKHLDTKWRIKMLWNMCANVKTNTQLFWRSTTYFLKDIF